MTDTLERPVDAPAPVPRGSAARALTWTGGIVGGLLLVSGAFSAIDVLVLGSDDATTTSETADYAAAPVVELVADGRITVTTGGDRVRVERTATTALTRAAYSVDELAGRLRVEYLCDWWRPGFCATSLDVTVPDGTSVVVRARDGGVTATGLSGPLDVHVSDGESSVSDIDGDVNVRTSDGRTDISDVRGSVVASSADGSITVSDVSGSVTTRTSDGSTEISQVRGDIDAQASDGAVTVYGTGTPVALDISTADGRQTVEGPVDSSSSLHVTIRTSDGAAAYLPPRG